jgi:microcystin degradation protein MlrC
MKRLVVLILLCVWYQPQHASSSRRFVAAAAAAESTTKAANANANDDNITTGTGTPPSKNTKGVIAVIEFMQETNSFSPVLTKLENFQSRGKDGQEVLWYNSQEILDHCTTDETSGHIAAFFTAVQDFDTRQEFQVVPLLQARSVSGGPLTEELYTHFLDHILQGLERLLIAETTDEESSSSASPLQGVQGIYLSLHGAMGVEGRTDPEGDLLESLRAVVGPDLPIAVTHDLHANLTRKRMALLTFLIGYRTNPHRDYYNVSYQAGKFLVQTLQGKIRPTMAYKKMRLLKGGGWTIDLLWPMRQIFSWMTQQEKLPNVLSLSNFMVHLWLDHDELGWATVAITDNDPALADQLASELADLNWEARTAESPTGVTPAEAIQLTEDAWLARYFGTTVWCDVSDAVGAGAPGESTWILKALMEHQRQQEEASKGELMEELYIAAKRLISYLTLRDAEAVGLVFDPAFEIGDTLTLPVGGKLDHKTNHPVTFTGTILKRIHDKDGSRIAILRHHGIHLILNEVPSPLHTPSYFTHVLGLSLWDADIVVVKNLFPFRYRYLLYNRQTIDVVTPGVTNIDVFQIPYTQIPRPIYPLDKDIMDGTNKTWRPEDYDNSSYDSDEPQKSDSLDDNFGVDSSEL